MTDCLHVGFKTIFRIRSSYSIVRFVVFSRNNKVDTIFWRINNFRYYIHTLAPQCYMIDILLMICNVQIFADTSRIWCFSFFFSRLRRQKTSAPRIFFINTHLHKRVLLITKMTSFYQSGKLHKSVIIDYWRHTYSLRCLDLLIWTHAMYIRTNLQDTEKLFLRNIYNLGLNMCLEAMPKLRSFNGEMVEFLA